jgi:hypothetical protein
MVRVFFDQFLERFDGRFVSLLAQQPQRKIVKIVTFIGGGSRRRQQETQNQKPGEPIEREA